MGNTNSMYAEGLDCARPNLVGGCGPQPLQVVREVQGSFAVIGLRAGYQIDAHWRTALSFNSVFDRIYYQTIGTPLNGQLVRRAARLCVAHRW
jgi:outer membrane receptor for ferric coprogen and ferric-rhodotorulic acid